MSFLEWSYNFRVIQFKALLHYFVSLIFVCPPASFLTFSLLSLCIYFVKTVRQAYIHVGLCPFLATKNYFPPLPNVAFVRKHCCSVASSGLSHFPYHGLINNYLQYISKTTTKLIKTFKSETRCTPPLQSTSFHKYIPLPLTWIPIIIWTETKK